MIFAKPKHEETVTQPAPAPKTKSSGTLISSGTELSGKIVSACDICVEGEVKGVMEIDGRLIVASGGRVLSESLCCRNAEVTGVIEGPVTVYEALKIRAGGVVTGEIAVAELLIEQGGSFNGTCRKLKPEEIPGAEKTIPGASASEDFRQKSAQKPGSATSPAKGSESATANGKPAGAASLPL